MTDRREFLTAEEAEAMLPDGDSIHTFRNPDVDILLGADWSREEIIKAIRAGQPELAGPLATQAGHGLVIHDPEPLYIATKAK